MPVEGRGLSWKQTQEVTKTQGLVMSLATPESVQKLQTALHDKAKKSPDFRFYALYDKVYRKDVLTFAYTCCKANGGAAGVDNQTFEDIEAYGAERWLDELTQELKSRTYRPLPVRRVYIPKPGGETQRPLGVPAIRDRAAMMAAVLVLDPIIEADLQPGQYAYRRDRSALDAVRHVHKRGFSRLFRYSSACRAFKIGGSPGRRWRHASSDQDVADSTGRRDG
jgi:hypothetical protein